MQYLLDTSICVFFLRGELNLDEKIKKIGSIETNRPLRIHF